uniref:F5/8 type C domain-containing protein n=1 Tax=Ciona savignyi TaxID=51511 RepID=H2YMH8_CIOSA
CFEPLGMEDRTILDVEITANSYWDENHAPYLARLNNQPDPPLVGCWAAALDVNGNVPAPGTVWITVQLVVKRTVTAVVTQGRPGGFFQWVTSYQVMYSDDGTSFTTAKDKNGADKVKCVSLYVLEIKYLINILLF